MTKQYSIAEAKNHLPRLVHEAEEGAAVEITRRGKPVAVLLSIEEYQRLAPPLPKTDFWETYQEWRKKYDVEHLDLDPDEIYKDVRDKSPGRDFSW
jgi:prevent-host-death family protein